MALPIAKINPGLEGEFTFRGRAYSVPFTMPGDLVQFKLSRARGRLGMEVVKIEPGPREGTVEPFCPVYGECGGCRGQHLPYKEQLRLKTDPIVSQMEALGCRPEVIAAPTDRGHRGRMDFVVEGPTVGLRGAGAFDRFVDIEHCAVQSPAANQVLQIVRRALKRNPCGFVRSTREGVLKYCTIRTGRESSVLVLTYEAGREESPEFLGFRKELESELPASFSLVGVPTTAPSDLSCVPGGSAWKGQDGYVEILAGHRFEVSYDAFFQPNPEAFELVLDFAVRTAPPAAGRLVDLYCGAGVLSAVWTAKFPGFSEAAGYEITESAVERAPANLKHFAGVHSFHVSDLQNDAPVLYASDTVICDPPRAGLSKSIVRRILEGRPAHVLYISCNPVSQIRDLKELAAAFRIRNAAIVDCYPQTGHLEQAVWLSRTEE